MTDCRSASVSDGERSWSSEASTSLETVRMGVSAGTTSDMVGVAVDGDG